MGHDSISETQHKIVSVTKDGYTLDNGDTYCDLFGSTDNVTTQEMQELLDNATKIITQITEGHD